MHCQENTCCEANYIFSASSRCDGLRSWLGIVFLIKFAPRMSLWHNTHHSNYKLKNSYITMRRLITPWLLLLVAFISVLELHAQDGTFDQFTITTRDGIERPYIVYTPPSIDKQSKRPLIIYLHGAVSSASMRIDPLGAAKRSPMTKLADERGYYVLYPYGQKGATWFDPVGLDMVLSELHRVQQQYPIDVDKVFVSGFSDGGSGAFYMATTCSTPFAGFIALNGSVSVAANIGTSPVYLENINGKPLYIVNTLSDMLYPVQMMQPTIDKIREYQPLAIFRTPEGNHEMSYFPQLRSEIGAFVDEHRRTPATSISLECADTTSNSYDWLTIDKLAPEQAPQPWHTPYTLRMRNDKASLGIEPDPAHRGEGMLVKGFGKRSAGRDMGVQAGDLILRMEETAINNRFASFTYLASKKAGDSTALTIKRGADTLVLEGKFPDGYEYEVFAKQPLSGKVRATLSGQMLDISTSRVAEITIDFARLPVKPKSKLTLSINGHKTRIRATGRQTFSTLGQ